MDHTKEVRLYAGNLPFSMTPEGLRALFETQGAVRATKIVMDRYSKRSRGYGFVEMASAADANNARAALDGFEVEGRKLTVSPAKSQNPGAETLDPPHLFSREDRFLNLGRSNSHIEESDTARIHSKAAVD